MTIFSFKPPATIPVVLILRFNPSNVTLPDSPACSIASSSSLIGVFNFSAELLKFSKLSIIIANLSSLIKPNDLKVSAILFCTEATLSNNPPNIALMWSIAPAITPTTNLPFKPIAKNPIIPIVAIGCGSPLTKLTRLAIDFPIKLNTGCNVSITPAPNNKTFKVVLVIASPTFSANFSILPKLSANDFSTNSALVFNAINGEPSITAI